MPNFSLSDNISNVLYSTDLKCTVTTLDAVVLFLLVTTLSNRRNDTATDTTTDARQPTHDTRQPTALLHVADGIIML